MAQCLRLAQEYQGIAESAAAALARSDDKRATAQDTIAAELTRLTKSARARLPTRMLRRADERFRKSKLLWAPEPS